MTLDKIKKALRVILITAEVTSKRTLTDAFYLFGILVQPLIIAMLGIWMLRENGGRLRHFCCCGQWDVRALDHDGLREWQQYHSRKMDRNLGTTRWSTYADYAYHLRKKYRQCPSVPCFNACQLPACIHYF